MKSLFSHRGAAAVEFALVLIPLIILTFGLIEFGLLMYNQQVLTNAAREGARRGIVQQTPRINSTEIENTVHTYADTHLVTFGGSAIPTITVLPALSVPCTAFGDNLTVTVTSPYTFLVVQNFIPGLGSLLTLNAVSVMKCE